LLAKVKAPLATLKLSRLRPGPCDIQTGLFRVKRKLLKLPNWS
jgi:hypothetical protein